MLTDFPRQETGELGATYLRYGSDQLTVRPDPTFQIARRLPAILSLLHAARIETLPSAESPSPLPPRFTFPVADAEFPSLIPALTRPPPAESSSRTGIIVPNRNHRPGPESGER